MFRTIVVTLAVLAPAVVAARMGLLVAEPDVSFGALLLLLATSGVSVLVARAALAEDVTA